MNFPGHCYNILAFRWPSSQPCLDYTVTALPGFRKGTDLEQVPTVSVRSSNVLNHKATSGKKLAKHEQQCHRTVNTHTHTTVTFCISRAECRSVSANYNQPINQSINQLILLFDSPVEGEEDLRSKLGWLGTNDNPHPSAGGVAPSGVYTLKDVSNVESLRVRNKVCCWFYLQKRNKLNFTRQVEARQGNKRNPPHPPKKNQN